MMDPSLDVLQQIFKNAPFIQHLGIELKSVANGECHTTLAIRPEHLQQNGVVHAGVITTLADHTGGGAAASVLPANSYPLTAEFKINLLRAASGRHLSCRARVLKAGRTLVVSESEVFAHSEGGESLVAKAIITLVVVRPGEKEIKVAE